MNFETPPTWNLENGRLTARPGPDMYLYTFKCPEAALPDIGQKGRFIMGAESIAARVSDRRGPQMTLCLSVEKAPLGASLSGQFRAAPVRPASVDVHDPFDENLKIPLGARQFLDSRDGWVMELTEAASQKRASEDATHWPIVPLAELPHRLSPAGLTFVWRQSPDPALGVENKLVECFSHSGRVLALGESPVDLEPLAEAPEALFLGPAAPGTPLHPISVYTKIAEAIQAKDMEQAELRNQMSDLKRAESSLKAEIARWDDLTTLEARFTNMGHEVARMKRRWDACRHNLDTAAKAWEEADLAAEKSGRGLLGRLKKSGPDEKALRVVSERRQSLNEAEALVTQVRHEEENVLEKALNLERQLSAVRLESQHWPTREEINTRFRELREREKIMLAKEAALAKRPIPTQRDMLAAAPLVLALIVDAAPGEPLHKARFTSVMALASSPPDHQGRLNLASLALAAEKNFLIMGDFTFWPVWKSAAPLLKNHPELRAWSAILLAEEADAFKQYLAAGGPFSGAPLPENFPGLPALARLEPGPEWTDFVATDFKYIVEPHGATAAPKDNGQALPPSATLRRKKKVTSTVPAFGIGLRGFGEIGPANPVSALMAARAAIHAERALSGHDPAVIILAASPSQSALINKMLRDLEAPAGRVYCGEPQDFRYWPKAPLVIVEPAFEAPHSSHPWAWPAFGRQRLALAWNLAADRIWVAGREAWMAKLPEGAPLGALWRLTKAPAPDANHSEPRGGLRPPTFWEALDKAKKEVWAILPTFEAFWWRPLEEHFLAAMRRRVSITILCSPPAPGQDRDYPSAAIRTLSAYGCSIHLAVGLPGFMAVVDGVHFTWGHFVEGAKGAHIWGGLKSTELPLAAPEIGRTLQIPTINEKLGRKGGGLKNCRVCGWPMVLINEESMRGYGDEQPLKVGCLGEHSGKFPRRLDEREPFLAPPRCGEDNKTPYKRKGKGRNAQWVCPNHPGGPRCPSYKAVPGDAK